MSFTADGNPETQVAANKPGSTSFEVGKRLLSVFPTKRITPTKSTADALSGTGRFLVRCHSRRITRG
jgi:hypothetical protein